MNLRKITIGAFLFINASFMLLIIARLVICLWFTIPLPAMIWADIPLFCIIGISFHFWMNLWRTENEITRLSNKIRASMTTIPNSDCSCAKCNPDAWWMVVCTSCGNKRCPRAKHHKFACTNSNECDQIGVVSDE